MARTVGYSATLMLLLASPVGAEVISSAGHGYSVECNKNGYMLRSNFPVYRWADSGFHELRKLHAEIIFLGKECDAFQKNLGFRGKWGQANGGFRIEFENTDSGFGAYGQFQPGEIGFPRQEIYLQCPRGFALESDCPL